jgi:dihydropteroate synthase
MAVLSVLRGAKIVRVHDVRETKIALKTLQLKDN